MAAPIVLIYPRFHYAAGDFSIGLASVGAYARRHLPDAPLSLIDTTFHPSLDHVRAELARVQPAVAGIYADTPMFPDALAVARVCREGGATVIVGGPHPTILPEETIAEEAVDAVCIGEGEETFREYTERLLAHAEPEGVRGVWFKRRGEVVRNAPRPPVGDLDALPPPAVDLYDAERYVRSFIQLDSYRPGLRGMSLVASRGCPFRCAYCQPTLARLFGPRLRTRSPQSVVEEVLALAARYRLDGFYFQDDTLTASPRWVGEFCGLLAAAGTGLVWACNTRADTWDPELLATMRRAGCVKLKVGIESVTDRIRNGVYRKNVSMEQVDAFVAAAGRAGIQVAGFFMIGAPTETVAEIEATIRYAVRSPLVEANFSVATALPATSLWETARERGWRLPASFADFDYYRARRPGLAPGDVPPAALERLRRKAVLQFYLHPRRAGRVLRAALSRAGAARFLVKLRRF
jgi:radical SAM superfamily enzyme YgiQ (UPF0313 family)